GRLQVAAEAVSEDPLPVAVGVIEALVAGRSYGRPDLRPVEQGAQPFCHAEGGPAHADAVEGVCSPGCSAQCPQRAHPGAGYRDLREYMGEVVGRCTERLQVRGEAEGDVVSVAGGRLLTFPSLIDDAPQARVLEVQRLVQEVGRHAVPAGCLTVLLTGGQV